MQNNVFNEYFAKGQFYEMVNGVKTLCETKSTNGQYATGTVDGNLLTAITGKYFLVLSLMIVNKGGVVTAVSLKTKPAGAGVEISPRFEIAADSNLIIPATQFGYFQTASGQGLTVGVNGADADVFVRYIEITS